MAARSCRYCDAPLVFLQWSPNHTMPVEAEPYKRAEGETLPKGIYFTTMGEKFNERDAPVGREVYLSHWAKCPGATKARKRP